MIAQTPNLRFVKPLSKYMALRIRMFGRQRFAKTFSQTGSNMASITLPFTASGPETLEVYLNDVRMLDGYSVNGTKVTFNPAVGGRIDCVDDDVFPDMNDKWLVIPTDNLLHYKDTNQTAYGTDRRDGQNIAVHAKPICITQGALGFCRPSNDGEQLLYCSYYGMYGRDSITYAIKTDLGQYSDFRCIDIRVRDPNYIPTMRLAVISAESSPVKADGVVKDIVPNGQFQLYAPVSNKGKIRLPNRVADELKEYHFVLQGSDENGDWFEPEEYFDPESYKVIINKDSGFVITYQGSGKDFGFENALLITVMCERIEAQALRLSLSYLDTELFNCTVETSVLRPLNLEPITIENPVIVLDKGESQATWTHSDEWVTGIGVNLDTMWRNEVAETVNVSASMAFDVKVNAYDPVAKANVPAIPMQKTVTGTFTTADDPANNVVVQPANSNEPLLENVRYWASSDPFSDVISGSRSVGFVYNWQIGTVTPPTE